MSYLFCALLFMAKASACVALGWFVWHGATTWLILPMILMCMSTVIPARDVFTCPKCGFTGMVKTFRMGDTISVQNKKGDPEEQ